MQNICINITTQHTHTHTNMSAHIYLEAIEPIVDRARVTVTLESYVCLFVHRYLNAPSDAGQLLFFVQPPVTESKDERTRPQHAFVVDMSSVTFEIIEHAAYGQHLASLCSFPVLVSDTNVVVAGLCGVCRRMVKSCGSDSAKHEPLLGFKSGCMLAPAEQSVWTRFCEVDVVAAVQRLFEQTARQDDDEEEIVLPSEFGRFELHMGQPVRMHNIYKVAREQAVKQQRSEQKRSEDKLTDYPVDDDELAVQLNAALQLNGEIMPRKIKSLPVQISSSVPMERLDIAHTFAEGQHLTLADVMLYACFALAHDQLLPANCVARLRIELPRFAAWLDTVRPHVIDSSGSPSTLALLASPPDTRRPFRVDRSDVRSLYKNDSKRYKPRSQIFTKQSDIDAALDKVRALRLDIRSDAAPRVGDDEFDWWSTLPYDARPEGGALPAERQQRKRHQLHSLAVEVLLLARPGDRVVDFCSGAGHLGIVVAVLRPDCEVVLLENKEESLQRARARVERLKLDNVRFFQCNLDYFCGPFDVGASLHACGVATDIVLEHCMRQQAAFVCCPCCYGGCRGVPHIEYPRSRLFGVDGGLLTAQDCMHVAHCADQAHDVRSGPCNETKAAQGQHCMDVMDWDRKVCAEERGYEVVLKRLQPEDCTPKNRLLVGRRHRADTNIGKIEIGNDVV